MFRSSLSRRHKLHSSFALVPFSTGARMLLALLVCAGVLLAIHARSNSAKSTTTSKAGPRGAITVQAAGRGKPYLNLNLQDGRQMLVDYRGAENATRALQSGQARARALASADFDGNATPDLVVGYAYNGGGIVTIQRGNPDAFAPNDDSVFVRMQQGYNPDALLPQAETYQVPEPVDFVQAGDFNHDNRQDVLVAMRGGDLFLLSGDGQGGLGAPEQIALPGTVTTVVAGEFRAADGQPDVAVGVNGPNGAELLIYDGAEGGLTGTPMQLSLPNEATAIQFGGMDTDPFMDLAVATGSEIEIVHGWGRKVSPALESRVERVNAPSDVRGMALGHFVWDREARQEIAALGGDGTVTVLQPEGLDTRPFTDEELFVRKRGRFKPEIKINDDVEATPGWKASDSANWTASRTFATSAVAGDALPQALLTRTNIASRQTEDLVITGSSRELSLVRQIDPQSANAKNLSQAAALSTTGDMATLSLGSAEEPIAVLQLPTKLNGERNLVVLQAQSSAPTIIPLVATSITVDRFDDVGIQATCSGALNDCNLRGAVQFANIAANSPTTINLPAGTYTLNTNGTSSGGCGGDGNAAGDLGLNLSTNITGVGAATTIIRQHGTNVGGGTPGDRVMCLNEGFLLNLQYTFSAVTIIGGRDFSGGGGGIIGGEQGNLLTISNAVVANNQSTGAGQGGGGILIQGGSLTITNSTIGGTNNPNVPAVSRDDVTQGNSMSTSGGGISYGSGQVSQNCPCVGTFTSQTTSTFSHNTAASATAGGGGLDLLAFNGGTGSANINGTTFSNNQALGSTPLFQGSGGGMILESTLATTITTSTFSNNSATNKGGGVFTAGGTLALDGTSPSVSFSSNTATVSGSSVGANAPVTVSGSNFTIDGSIDVLTNGTWTDNTGSTFSLTNINVFGTFTNNNSTLNISGNLLVGVETGGNPGGKFNANTGTINLQGNLTVNDSGLASPNNTQFNGGTSNFNFTGAGAQSINGSGSPVFNFANLTVNKTGTLTANRSASVVGGNLTVTAGTFDLLGNTFNRSVAGGTLTVSGGATMKIGGANSLPTNYTTISLTNTGASLSTIEFEGASAQIINALNYGNLVSSGAGGRTLVNGSTTGISGTFTPGANAYTVTGSTVDFNGTNANSTGAQTVPALNYNNLTISGARVSNSVTLINGGTIGVAGVFSPTASFTTGGYIITGNTFNFNGTGSQTVPAFAYNNLTLSGARTGANNITLVNGGTIGVAGAFSPTATFGTGNYITTNNTMDFNGTGAQTIAAFNLYNNLTISGARGANNVTLVNGGTIGVAGIFSPTATFGGGAYVITGNTFDFNGTGAQTVPAFNFNNLTISGARTTNNVTFVNGGTIGVAGTFSLTATFTSGVVVTTSNTMDFNGTGAQTIPAFAYNNLTISGARGANNVTLVNGGTISVLGTFSPTATFGGGAYVITGNTFTFNGAGTQTVPAFNFNNLTISNTHGANAVTLVNGGTIGVAGTFTPGTSTFVITGNAVNFNGAGVQTIPAFNFNDLTVSNTHGANAVTLGATIGVAGTFTPGTSTFVITGNTMDFNGAGTQTVPAFNFNNLNISNTHGANAVTLVNGGTIGVAGTFTPGTSTFVITGNAVNFNGAGVQTIPAFNFNDLTVSNTHGANAVTLINGGTIGVAGTFTPGTSTFVITGNAVNFNGAGVQTIPAFNFNDLTISNTHGANAVTLVNGGTIGVAGTFTPGTSTFTITGNTFTFNGAGTQTVPAFNFNNLTISNTHGANAVTLINGGTIGVAGTFTPGTSTFVITGNAVNFNGAGVQTIPAFNFNDLIISNTHGANAVTLVNGGTIGVAGTFTPGTSTFTITGNTINFNGAGTQTITGFTYNNLTSSGGAAARTLDAVNTIKIAGAFTPGTNVYTITGSTIEYNGTALQTLPSSGFNTYNNLTLNNAAGTQGFAGLTVNGLIEVKAGTFTSASTYNNVQVDTGGTLAGTAATTINVSGNWTINTGGAFTPNTNTVNFNGSGAQTIGGTATTAAATTFNNLTIANAGSGVTLGQNETVNGVLTLTNDLNTSTFTLTQPSTAPASVGVGDVVGNIKRTGTPLPSTTLTYGNLNNTIGFTAGTPPTDITVTLTKTAPTDAATLQTNSAWPAAILRTYLITPTGGSGFSATMQLHYNAGDLNGNTAGNLKLWKFVTSPTRGWSEQSASTDNGSGVGVSLSGMTGFSPWTMANVVVPSAASGNVSGQIVDNNGNPVEGAAVRMSGTQNRLTVTDTQGNYHFDNVETNGFYTVVPTRSNFTFSPSQRAFSQLGQHTDATFSASLTSGGLNPLDATEYFVRQQYLDFLGREPDEAGFNFWVNNIESCGTDQNCRAVARINTSGAFFLSIEFQQTGYLVYRTYQAAYGDMPNAPVPIRLNEFKPDTAEIGNGVVVLQSGWEQKLDNNKQAFTAEFVQRGRFTAVYPTTMTPAEFVDKLFANASVAPTASDRTAAINEFGTAGTSSDVAARGRALRRVAENSTLAQQEFNRAFVLMEYFGYLQRDANTRPDTDFTGYNYWLDKLNSFNGNFQNAEMVNAFLVSSEYRGRFPR